MKSFAQKAIIEQLQKQILQLEGHRAQAGQADLAIGLGAMESAFPEGVFPRAAVHEFISFSAEDATCTNGFMSVILGKLMQGSGSCLWIGKRPTIYPPALKAFGIEPERMLFAAVPKAKDALWAMEEALKCDALTAVVGELGELSFSESRKLQLAVERSRVTGFIHRHQPKAENAVTCVTRWKITTLSSDLPGNMPGVGFPQWNVRLLKVRSGHPGEWQVQWSPKGLEYKEQPVITLPGTYERQIG